MPIVVDRAWRVKASEQIELPMRASRAWGQMRDMREFLTIDPLHAKVRFDPPEAHVPRVGTPIVIEHRFLGLGPDRIGRVLRWREGSGFVVSDLSRRGMKVGFPHICAYAVEPISDHRCRLTMTARGRWTATFLPRWVVRLWMWWVMSSTRQRITMHFMAMRQ